MEENKQRKSDESSEPDVKETLASAEAEKQMNLSRAVKEKNQEIQELKAYIKRLEEENKKLHKFKIFEIGERIELGGTFMTVNNIEDIPISQGNGPNPGNKFVVIDVTIGNQGAKLIKYKAGEFILRDLEGFTYDQLLIPLKYPYFFTGLLSPGCKKRGWITFEIPESIPELQLVYQPDWWDGEQIIVKLE
jgi:hypothetical protein